MLPMLVLTSHVSFGMNGTSSAATSTTASVGTNTTSATIGTPATSTTSTAVQTNLVPIAASDDRFKPMLGSINSLFQVVDTIDKMQEADGSSISMNSETGEVVPLDIAQQKERFSNIMEIAASVGDAAGFLTRPKNSTDADAAKQPAAQAGYFLRQLSNIAAGKSGVASVGGVSSQTGIPQGFR